MVSMVRIYVSGPRTIDARDARGVPGITSLDPHETCDPWDDSGLVDIVEDARVF
jgi:hypothetical protein